MKQPIFILCLLLLGGCATRTPIKTITPVYGKYDQCGKYKFTDPRCNETMLTAGGGGSGY